MDERGKKRFSSKEQKRNSKAKVLKTKLKQINILSGKECNASARRKGGGRREKIGKRIRGEMRRLK